MQIVQRGSTRTRSLQIALVVAIAAAAMSGSCTVQTAATRCEKTGLTCPPGWVCSADEDSCIRAGSCGNNIVSDGEVCDNGDNRSGDGCSADCQSDESCGNKILDIAVGEICDDGNQAAGDGCNEVCRAEVCGNLLVEASKGEECDTGPGDSFGCDSDCSFRRCGDGHLNMAAEDCETTEATNDCDNDCTFAVCGDKDVNTEHIVFEPPGEDPQTEACDAGEDTGGCNGNEPKGRGNCQKPACGDGYANQKFKVPGQLGAFEFCDMGGDHQDCNGNGNANSTKKGEGNCQEPKCGDGYANKEFKPDLPDAKKEQCDNGKEDTEGCNGDENATGKGICQEPACGDGYENEQFTPPGVGARLEVCDKGGDSATCNGNSLNFDGTAGGKCQPASCGDGYRNPMHKPGPSDGAGLLEACDEGGNSSDCNGNDNLDGKGNCQKSECGDGYINPADEEACDTGTPNPDAPCGADRCVACKCVDIQ